MQETVHLLAAGVLLGQRQLLVLRIERVVVGHADGVDAGPEHLVVGDALHLAPVDEHVGLQGSERLAVISGGHQHGLSPCGRLGRRNAGEGA